MFAHGTQGEQRIQRDNQRATHHPTHLPAPSRLGPTVKGRDRG